MCDKIKVYYGKYLHLYLITVLTKVIAIVFVFENFIVFVIVFKYYACIWTQVWLIVQATNTSIFS